MRELLKGYKLEKGSPAVQAGVRLESMSTGIPVGMTGTFSPLTDFFGNEVAADAKIDIGAHQSGMTASRITSDAFAVDNVRKTITVTDTTVSSAMLASLQGAEGMTAVAKRGGAVLADNVYLTAGDVVEITAGGETVTYTIRVQAAAGNRNEIPAAKHRVAAGNQDSRDPVENVLNDSNRIWHTDWNGSPRDQHWLTLTIEADEYKVTGLTYLPRTTGGTNGMITKYQVLGSNDGQDWTELASGTWPLDTNRKYVDFSAPQSFTQYKLVSVESSSNQSTKEFTSAQEVRLLGYEEALNIQPAAPTGVTAQVQDKAVSIQWANPAETSAVRYEIRNGETLLAAVPAAETGVVLNGLPVNKDIQLTLVAVNQYGTTAETAVPVIRIQDEPFAWTHAKLSIAGNIAVYFYGTFNQELVENGMVEITVEGQPAVQIPVAQGKKTENGREFAVTVSARQMTDNIEIKVMQNDQQIGVALNYTVRKNAEKLMEIGTKAEADFARAMLFHGAAMQQYKGYHTDRLATADLDMKAQEEAAAAVTAESLAQYKASVAGEKLDGLSLYGMNLSLKDETTLRYFFTVDEANQADKYTFTANGKTWDAYEKDGYLCVDIPNFAASRLDTMVDMVVSDGANQMTIHYGPLSYAESAVRNHSAVEDVARSLVVYNAAANNLYE